MLAARNEQIRPLLQPRYSLDELAQIQRLIAQQQTLRFPSLPTGLFSAALVTSQTEQTGYKAAWVRDNVHVAHAHLVNGRPEVARRNAEALCEFFARQRERFLSVIEDPAVAAEPMQRPHIRFDGEKLAELLEKWSHAQNDALGYFVWLYAKLARQGVLPPAACNLETLALFPEYFRAIEFWQDEDSGHWEETRKVSASSIGVVVAGLRELRAWLQGPASTKSLRSRVSAELLDELIDKGTAALHAILPAECAQPNPAKSRPHDAALLFLVYPLQVVGRALATRIVDDVVHHLQGDHGIKRYLRDSFYCTDYEHNLNDQNLTADYSDDLTGRDAFFVEGGEAQWCLFDPVVSIYYGREYQRTAEEAFLVKQTEYLNRSLRQITGADDRYGAFQCPELYYREGGRLQTSKSTPLLWTQANLWVALKTMEESLRVSG
jgi:phosphorylase kinase alpha/beta subunit